MRRIWIPIAALFVVIALVATACGGDDDGGDTGGGETGGSNNPTGVQEGTGDRKATAEAAAEEIAGDPVELPKKKAGILQILGAIESAQRAENAMNEAIKTLGWTSTSCDAQGDPTKMASCGDSLLNSGAEVIFVIGVEPSLIKAQLAKAKKRGVPVVEFSGQVEPDPNWSGAYYPDEAKAGEILAESLLDRLSEVDGTAEISVADYPAKWATDRTDQLKALVEESENAEISVESVTDGANLVQGTQQTVTDELTQNPDLNAFWFAFDSAGQAAAPVLSNKFQGKEFPEKPWVVTFHADLGTQELMREGGIDEVLDVPYDAPAWVAADQAAQFFARETEFDKSSDPKYGSFEIYDYELVTRENLPPPGEYRETANDFVTFFKTKWAQEFGQ